MYGELNSPLAQPRAVFGGHFVGALTGICITKLFHLLPTEARFNQLQWLAGSLSVAVAIVLMQVTGTVHPPAGRSWLDVTVLIKSLTKPCRYFRRFCSACGHKFRYPQHRVVLPACDPSFIHSRLVCRADCE